MKTQRISLSISLAATLALIGAVAACSDDSSSGGGSGGATLVAGGGGTSAVGGVGAGGSSSTGKGGGTSTGKGGGTSTGAGGGGPGAGGGSGGDCSDLSGEACFQCCDEQSNGGLAFYLNTLISSCGCSAKAVCKTECAETCSSQQLDESCVSCLDAKLDADQPCAQDLIKACQSKPDCVSAVQCAQACPE